MRKMVIDFDAGVDDAIALMLALHSPDIHLLAITCVAGNTTVDNVCVNTARVLQLCGKQVGQY